MDAEKLYEMVKRHPFEAVRIHLSDGSSYEITHPDQVMVTRRWSYVGIGGNGDKPFQDTAVIDNVRKGVRLLFPLKVALGILAGSKK